MPATPALRLPARLPAVAGLALVAVLATGCISTGPYRYGMGLDGPDTLRLRAGEEQVERGRPVPFLDVVANVFSLPGKLVLLNWKVDNHDIGEAVEIEIVRYLEANGLCHVKVRLNQYAPGAEWSRLARNRAVSPAWRWTLGMIGTLSYTIFPGRLFGGDNYNPYTNTINLYSDLPAIALHEAGHAKDFAGTRYRGFYAALRLLPLLPLLQEARATSDAISYAQERSTPDIEKQAYRVLYPAYGTYVGGEASQYVGGGWIQYAVQYGAVIPGHVIGWIQSAFVDDQKPVGPVAAAVPGPALPMSQCERAAPPAGPAPPAYPTDEIPEDALEPL